MRQFCITFMEALIASVFLVPIFFHLNRTRFQNRKTSFLYFLLAFYLCGVYAVAGLPNITYIRFRPNINLQPFLYMFSAFSTSFLNVVLFLPLGFLLTLLWKPFRNPLWNLLAGLGISLFIELLQIFTFRATDINDLITNTLGAFWGWLLGRIVIKCVPKTARDYPVKDFPLISSFVLLVMFFLHPFLSSFLWQLFFKSGI